MSMNCVFYALQVPWNPTGNSYMAESTLNLAVAVHVLHAGRCTSVFFFVLLSAPPSIGRVYLHDEDEDLHE